MSESLTPLLSQFLGPSYGPNNIGQSGNSRVFLQTSQLATAIFGGGADRYSENFPRLAFNYIIRINFNVALKQFTSNYFSQDDEQILQYLVKSVDLPSVSIDTETVNQYNRPVVIQKKINYEDVVLNMYDVIDGKTLKFWEMYYEYYFRNGLTSKLNGEGAEEGIDYSKNFQTNGYTKFNGDFGYNIEQVGKEKHLIESIDIFQIFGGWFSTTHIINPKIKSFTPSTLEYGANEVCELEFVLQHEGIIYENRNQDFATSKLTKQELDFLSQSQFKELSMSLSSKKLRRRDLTNANSAIQNANIDKRDRNLGYRTFVGRRNGTLLDAIGVDGSMFGDSIIGKELGDTVTGLDRRLTSLVRGLPKNVASTVIRGVTTGDFKFRPNLKDSIKNIGRQESDQVIYRQRRNFGSIIENAGNDIIGSVLNNDDQGGIDDGFISGQPDRR